MRAGDRRRDANPPSPQGQQYPIQSTIAVIVSIGVLWACWRLTDHVVNVWIGAALAIGVGVWVVRGGLLCRPRELESVVAARTSLGVRWMDLSVALALVPIAFVQAADNQFRIWGVVAWVGAIVYWLVAWWPAPARARLRRPRPDPGSIIVGLGLLAIVGLGAHERLGQLPNTPAEPTSDHAEKLLDITDLLNGERPIFFERNTGREPLQFYFTAFGLIRGLDLPVEYETLKIGMALADVLAIVVVFLLAAELAGREAGLLAALLYATAAWSTIIGSFGLRPSLGPLTAGLALWLFLRYLRTGDRRLALLTGLTLGAGLYGYTAFRTVPLVVGLSLIFVVLLDPSCRGVRKRMAADATLMAATAVIVSIPLLRYITQYWDRFWYRTTTRTGSTEPAASGSEWDALADRLRLFAENNWRAIQMFHWRGDAAWVSFAPSRPALDYVTGAALIIGCAVIARHLIRTHDLRFATLVVAIPIMLLSSTLALEFQIEVPSFSRSFLVAPIIFAIAAIGLVVLRREIARVANPVLSGIVVGVLLLLAARENDALVREYDAYYRATVANSIEIAHTAIAAEQRWGIAPDRVFLVGAPHWVDHRNIAFELGDIGWGSTNLVNIGAPMMVSTADEPALFIVNLGDTARLDQLQRRWPDGTAVIAQSARPGKQFGLFFVGIDPAGTSELSGLPLLPMPSPCRQSATSPSLLCLHPGTVGTS